MSTVQCFGLGHLFFPDPAEGNAHLVKLAKAQSICGACSHADACLQGAIARREPCGIWGGENIENGRVVPLPRPQGRPRKVAA